MITSFTDQADSQLPEYLLEWPRLRGQQAIDTFARYYKQQQRPLNEEVLEKRASASQQLRTVNDFHRQLKAALGQ